MSAASGSHASTGVRRSGSRLAWLDVLRGIAALCVVYEHMGYHALVGVRDTTNRWIDAGMFGVVLFFVISGYIIPASLERKGSLRGFWISRLFRLYPLWIAAIAVVWLMRTWGHYTRDDRDKLMFSHTSEFALSHATMLQDLLNVPSTVNVMWSLSYEMVFYCVVGGLFVVGLHRYSAHAALAFAFTALVFGLTLPNSWFSDKFGTTAVAGVVAVLFFGGVGAMLTGRRTPAMVGGVGLGVMALLLVTANGRDYPWEGLLIPAYMFVGTVIYRVHSGQLPARVAWLSAGSVLTIAVVADVRGTQARHLSSADQTVEIRRWVMALLVAALVFSVGLVLRHREFPQPLQWLGRISFSLYFLHPILIGIFEYPLERYGWSHRHHHVPISHQLLVAVIFFAAVIATSGLTFRYIETPTQNLGRRVTRWCDERFGSDVRIRPTRPDLAHDPALGSVASPAAG